MGKRANGEGSIFKIKTGDKKGQWRAVLTVGRNADGTRRRRSKVAKTQADALALLDEMREELKAGLVSLPRNPTLSEFMTAWLDDVVKPNSAANTHALYKNASTKHIAPQLGGYRLSDVSTPRVHGMLAEWRRAKLGTRTQQVSLATLSRAMNAAVGMGLVRSNPCRGVKRPTNHRKPVDPFTASEVEKIIKAADSPQATAFLRLAFTTGMREGELFGLPWRCVDLDAATVRVEQQVVMVGGKTSLGRPKTKRSLRTIDLTPKAVADLVSHRKQLLKDGEAGRDLVFTAARGGLLSRNNFRNRIWLPTLKRAGVRARTFHQTRHTFATLALNAGVPVHDVSAMLGHARASVTLDVYAASVRSQQAAARDAIARLLG